MIMMLYCKKYKNNISNFSIELKSSIFYREKRKCYNIYKISNYKNNYLRYCIGIRIMHHGDNYYSAYDQYVTNFDAFTYIRKEISTIDYYSNPFTQICMAHYKVSIKDYI